MKVTSMHVCQVVYLFGGSSDRASLLILWFMQISKELAQNQIGILCKLVLRIWKLATRHQRKFPLFMLFVNL